MLSLKPIERQDLGQLRKWRNDPKIYQWCRQYEPLTEAQHEAWFNSLHGNRHIKMYAIGAEGHLIGVCGLTDIDWVNRRAEFSLYIGPNYQGFGYGAEALRLLCGHGFKVLNLNMIWGEVFDGNPAMKTFEQVGFKVEGRRREFYYRNGQYIDAVLISLLKREFNG